MAGTPAIRRSLEERSVGLSVNQWPWPRNRAKLVNITPISVWLMILITSYKYRIYRELLNPLMTSRGPVTVKQCEESRICLARSMRTSPNPQVTPTMAGE